MFLYISQIVRTIAPQIGNKATVKDTTVIVTDSPTNTWHVANKLSKTVLQFWLQLLIPIITPPFEAKFTSIENLLEQKQSCYSNCNMSHLELKAASTWAMNSGNLAWRSW